MISYVKNGDRFMLYGLSTDVVNDGQGKVSKPRRIRSTWVKKEWVPDTAYNEGNKIWFNMPNASVFYEMDTKKTFMMDEHEDWHDSKWLEQ